MLWMLFHDNCDVDAYIFMGLQSTDIQIQTANTENVRYRGGWRPVMVLLLTHSMLLPRYYSHNHIRIWCASILYNVAVVVVSYQIGFLVCPAVADDHFKRIVHRILRIMFYFYFW